ncbi:hypothetical protein [Erythrobacter sp. Alg231-14]|uniref:hypothetical protein n=1 Tax=Erythrobacter sp. Alg231-14 TaxID=1922225 RepID=UPI000D54E2A0
MSKETEADFFRHGIQDLPAQYLKEWFSAAYATGGVEKDIWTYLLPRVLEVLALGKEPDCCGIEISLNRFKTGNPDNWNKAQWSVLDQFQRQFLRSGFETECVWQEHSLDDILCMFALGGWSLDDLLNQVNEISDEALARRLFRDWCQDFGGYGTIWATSFWPKADEKKVMGFYTSDALRLRMERLALSDDCEKDVAQMASDLVTVIEDAG